MQGDVEGAGGLEALGQGVAGTPGHAQQDEEQAAAVCQRQARRAGHGLLRLLPDLGCEKVTQALQKRLRLGGRCGSGVD